jgi:tetratricopeptide (TPR) repeat protein
MQHDNSDSGRPDHSGWRESSDLYESAYQEKSLQDNELASRTQRVSRIDRKDRKKGFANPKRDLSTLFTILKMGILLIVILIGFFLVRAGIGIYSQQVQTDQMEILHQAPVMESIELIADVAFEEEADKISFFEREIEKWEASRRYLRAAEQLVKSDNLMLATEKAQAALVENPASVQALGLLADLYEDQGMYVEAINAAIRLLALDSLTLDRQVKLLRVLYKFEDYESVIHLASYFGDEQGFQYEIEHLHAFSCFALERDKEAESIFLRLLKEKPDEIEIINALIQMKIKSYKCEEALELLDQVYESRYREKQFYLDYAYCAAYLNQVDRCLEMLTKAIHIFGVQAVLPSLYDPVYDELCEDSLFRLFVKRIAGEAFFDHRIMMREDEKSRMESPERVDESAEIKVP